MNIIISPLWNLIAMMCIIAQNDRDGLILNEMIEIHEKNSQFFFHEFRENKSLEFQFKSFTNFLI